VRQRASYFAFTLAIFVSACATADFAPPPSVSPSLVTTARADGASAQKLVSGRAIFVSRCLECHTLPPVARYSPDQWPHLVARMADRADLTPDEQGSLTMYLRAASISAKREE
jgi:mono/diheme cytochrome c family protein